MGKALATLIRYATRDQKMVDKHQRVGPSQASWACAMLTVVCCAGVCGPSRLFGHEPLPDLAQFFHPSRKPVLANTKATLTRV